MARILSAVFDDRNDAERAVDWLRSKGVGNDAISLVSRHEGSVGGDQLPDPGSPDGKRSAADGAGEAGGGLATGLGVGAGVGALFGLAALMIPGVGPLIAAGPLAAALGTAAGTVAAGAIVGGTAGGLAGALGHWGLSEAEAHHYAKRIEGGGTYLGVDLDQTSVNRSEAMEAMRRFNGNIHDVPEDGGVNGLDTITDDRPLAAGTYAETGSMGANHLGRTGAKDYQTGDLQSEARMPLVEEEAVVNKRTREAGEVELTKRVDTETRHISEPVMHERVRVDVRPVDATDARNYDATSTLQPGETIRVPVREEELIVDKQARVTGEAVISTERDMRTVDQDVQLRKERVEVNQIGDVDADIDGADDLITTGRRNTDRI